MTALMAPPHLPFTVEAPHWEGQIKTTGPASSYAYSSRKGIPQGKSQSAIIPLRDCGGVAPEERMKRSERCQGGMTSFRTGCEEFHSH